MDVEVVELGMVLIGMWMLFIYMLLIIPILLQWDKRSLVLYYGGFVDGCGAVIVIARGEIFPSYTVAIWLTSIYFVWFVMKTLKQKWLR